MSVVNVKVAYLRPKYPDLQAWTRDPQNVYVGRRGIVFVTNPDGSKQRFPPQDSPWHNPFKVGKDGTREEVVAKYRAYIIPRIERGELDLSILKGKNLGCWCAPELCHGHVLLDLINYYCYPQIVLTSIE